MSPCSPRCSRSSAAHRALLIAALAVATLGAVEANAQAGETESRTLFVEGRELRKAGRCADAIVAFRRALETYPEGLGALRNIAECEEELGRFASARRSYWDLRLAALQSTSTKYAGWDQEAEAAHTRLAAKVAKVTIQVVGVRPDGLVILLNGRTFDPRLLGVEIEQDDGPLEVSASNGAGPPLTEKLTVQTAGRHVVRLDVTGLKPATPPPARGGTSEPSGVPAMKIGGIVALGIGGVGVVGTVVSLAMRQSALATVEDACPSREGCAPSLQGDIDRGEAASLFVNVFAATAVVGAGVGVTLLLLAPSEGETAGATRTPRATLAATPLPGGGYLGISGTL